MWNILLLFFLFFVLSFVSFHSQMPIWKRQRIKMCIPHSEYKRRQRRQNMCHIELMVYLYSNLYLWISFTFLFFVFCRLCHLENVEEMKKKTKRKIVHEIEFRLSGEKRASKLWCANLRVCFVWYFFFSVNYLRQLIN